MKVCTFSMYSYEPGAMVQGGRIKRPSPRGYELLIIRILRLKLIIEILGPPSMDHEPASLLEILDPARHVLDYRPYFWNSQSRLSSGHTCRVFSHREMQWKWNACCERVS